MRFSLTALLRFAAIAFLVSSVAAIGVARLVPEGRGWRMPHANGYVNFPANLLRANNDASRWLDVNRGEITTVTLPPGDVLHYASAAPWVDEQGRSEVVGLWVHYGRDRCEMTDLGLARVSFPDGELREIVHSEVLPAGMPAWYPGTRSRVLFASGEGVLYHHEFGADAKGEALMGQPRAIRWACETPGVEGAIIADPHWVNAPHVKNLVLVSLQTCDRAKGKMSVSPSRIWWLRLSDDGCDVVAAGPLAADTAGSSLVELDDRYPTTGRNASGQLVLVYQRKVGANPWEIYVAPFHVDRVAGRPMPMLGGGRKLASESQPLPNVISADGRWLGFIDSSGESEATPRRVLLEPVINLASLIRRDLAVPR